MTGPCAYPALLRNDDGDRFIDDLEFDDGFFCFFDHGAAVVAELLFVAFDFLDQQALHRARVIQQILQGGTFTAQRREFLRDLDGFQSRQLTQTDFENVFGLAVGQFEGIDQRRLRFIRFTNDLDHLVDIEQDRLAAFQDMNPGHPLFADGSGSGA